MLGLALLLAVRAQGDEDPGEESQESKDAAEAKDAPEPKEPKVRLATTSASASTST